MAEPTAEQQWLDLQSGSQVLFVMGLLRDRFVLITGPATYDDAHYWIYDLPPSALDVWANRLSLDQGGPLVHKWGHLQAMFEMYDFHQQELITMQQSATGHGLVLMQAEKPFDGALAFDIESQNMTQLPTLKPLNVRRISTPDEMTFYGIEHKDTRTIAQYKLNLNPTDPHQIDQSTPSLVMCGSSANESSIKLDILCDDQPLEWHVLNGFADKDRLYLVEASKVVHIFDRSALDSERGNFVPLTTVPLDTFFHTPIDSNQTGNQSSFANKALTQASLSQFAFWPIIVTVFLLILLLCFVGWLCCCVDCNESSPESKENADQPKETEGGGGQLPRKGSSSHRKTRKANKSRQRGSSKSRQRRSSRRSHSKSRQRGSRSQKKDPERYTVQIAVN